MLDKKLSHIVKVKKSVSVKTIILRVVGVLRLHSDDEKDAVSVKKTEMTIHNPQIYTTAISV
jgi:hypothetical protein